MKYDIRIPVAERCLTKNNRSVGMQIKDGAWHLKLFREAYIDNRGLWLDSQINLDCERPKELNDLPEVIEWRKAEESWDEEAKILSWKEFKEKRGKKYEELNLLRQKAREAQSAWLEEELKTRSARLSAELADKLESGRMSLCPYFRSIVLAVLFYVPFVRNRSIVARGAIACLLGCLIFGGVFAGYLGLETAWQKKDDIANGVGHAAVATERFATEGIGENLNKAVVAVSVMRAERRIKEVARENYETKHAAEIAAEKVRQAVAEKVSAGANWKDLKETFWVLLVALAWSLGLLLAAGFVLTICFGLLCLVEFVFSAIFKFLAPSFLRVWKVLEGPETINRWLTAYQAIANPVAGAFATWQKFWSDTWSLITAFAKATKEQVCPFLVIVDEKERN